MLSHDDTPDSCKVNETNAYLQEQGLPTCIQEFKRIYKNRDDYASACVNFIAHNFSENETNNISEKLKLYPLGGKEILTMIWKFPTTFFNTRSVWLGFIAKHPYDASIEILNFLIKTFGVDEETELANVSESFCKQAFDEATIETIWKHLDALPKTPTHTDQDEASSS